MAGNEAGWAWPTRAAPELRSHRMSRPRIRSGPSFSAFSGIC